MKLPVLGFWRDAVLNRSEHCAPGNSHALVPLAPETPTSPLKNKNKNKKIESSVGCRINCFRDVNLDELLHGCVVLDAKYPFKFLSFVALREEEAGKEETEFPS